MITEKEFIDKVNKQRGWVDTVDAFLLVHFFTQRFGIIYTDLSIEDELIYMWEKLTEVKNIPNEKICSICKVNKRPKEIEVLRDKLNYLIEECLKLLKN